MKFLKISNFQLIIQMTGRNVAEVYKAERKRECEERSTTDCVFQVKT